MMTIAMPSMPVQPIQCNDPSSSMFETTSMNWVAHPLQALLHADTPECLADNQNATMSSLSLGLDPHSVHPTPISKRNQLTIVKEIKLGSCWHPHDDTELLYQLLVPSIKHEEATLPITNSSSRTTPSPLSSTDQRNVNLVSQKNLASQKKDTPVEEDNETIESSDKSNKWHERFHHLLKFRDEHGNCLVPHNWQANRQLAQWVKRQRYQFKLKSEGKHSTLTETRMKVLDQIGFVWSRHSAGWEERYNDLVDFARVHGHCHVPSTYPENHQLSVWVRCQRQQYKLGRVNNWPSAMARERSLRLLRLGFVFNPRKVKP
jgi:Helicase associated domain